MEWTYGVAIASLAALLCQKACRRITGQGIGRDMVTTEHRKSVWKQWPNGDKDRHIKILCLKHKNNPSKRQIRRGQHPKRQKTFMHGTKSGTLQSVLGRPEFLELNLTMTGIDCQALSWIMTWVWESLSLQISYAKVEIVGVPEDGRAVSDHLSVMKVGSDESHCRDFLIPSFTLRPGPVCCPRGGRTASGCRRCPARRGREMVSRATERNGWGGIKAAPLPLFPAQPGQSCFGGRCTWRSGTSGPSAMRRGKTHGPPSRATAARSSPPPPCPDRAPRRPARCAATRAAAAAAAAGLDRAGRRRRVAGRCGGSGGFPAAAAAA
jgi:hypothetical protein